MKLGEFGTWMTSHHVNRFPTVKRMFFVRKKYENRAKLTILPISGTSLARPGLWLNVVEQWSTSWLFVV